MGNSNSGKLNFEYDADEIDLPSEFGYITEEGLPLNKKARKTLLEIRRMMEKHQPLSLWNGQLARVNNYIEEKRVESMKDPDVQHATRLQRKLRASPRGTVGRRSVSAPERLVSLSRRRYVNGMDLQLSRTKSVLEIELSNWFGLRVDDLAHRVYLKYLSVSPLVEEFNDSDDEESEEFESQSECECQCHHHHCDQVSNNADPIKEQFIEDTVSHVLEFKKLLSDKAMNSKKKSERNAHAAKINDTVRSFIQHTTSHFFKKFDMNSEKKSPEKVAMKGFSDLSTPEKLLSLKKKIQRYSGRASSKAFFNEVFVDFLKTYDHCECAFVKDGRGIEKASIKEVAIHAHHHLQSVEKVKELFLELLKESPEDLKTCPIEMQIIYQCMANNLLDGGAMQNEFLCEKGHVEVTKEPMCGLLDRITATFHTPGMHVEEEIFGQLPREVQKAMEEMMCSSKKGGRVVVKQSITVNRQTLKKLIKK